ncbi:HK97 family phage portal protein [Bradyrhizobium japonicum]|uniref:phage portal protein n=1 Tax=Bradyrhizobium elkanii TaxID=29448 RepID=UPI0003741AA1|nr:phage portal protein [Bradyrhizobium elkanii]WAX24345.1 portal protein [Bradyrhizobium phage ppBeUSDA76-1]MCP1731278.1 HK97 family phage portal protein [Bradyrhizobium elkanii]MCS3575407.1 HK97 family phage portal protein [Bradyrhizobium elkanii]MCS3591902.1 HK97 family phage portal protein [Bradyrhizobium elkanii]MCS3621347.1 HK97 family phage portal protein [Bradyrhizobium elkanii]
MGLLQRIIAPFRKNGGDPDGTLRLFREIYGRGPSKSGRTVNVVTALEVATVFACLRVIAEGVAQSPCDLFRDRAGGGKDLAVDHPLYLLFALSPNDLQTTFEFFETLVFHAGLTGNFVAFRNIVRGRVVELIPFEPGTYTIKLNDDRTLTYKLRRPNGQTMDFPQEAVWHVRGPSWNGWAGMDLLRVAREAVGLSIAIESDQAQLYKNGLRTSGTYSVEGSLGVEQYKELREFIREYQADQEGGPLILDRAAKYLQETMTGVDAQTLESRKLQIEEICRIFRVMPIMVGHAGNTSPTFASAEQFFIAHVVHTLLPWCRRIETSINKFLIGERDYLAGVKAKFNLNALMRGSFADRQKAFAQMLGLGGAAAYAEVNEVRELDDMNPVAWGSGKPEPAQATKKPNQADSADNPQGDA